jgi:hypothetical protein
MNSVFKVLIFLYVGQSHESFTLLSVKDLMFFQHCQQAIRAVHTLQKGGTLKQI